MKLSETLVFLIDALKAYNREHRLIHSLTTLRNAGIPTKDKGVILQMKDGSRFQLTILVQSKLSEDE